MALEEMVHDQQFSLFDAMNAIEIGDPKMDIGLLYERPATTISELARAGTAPIDVNEETIAAIGDRLLQMEATWLSGSILGMTVFTCLYVLDPGLEGANPALQAMALGIRTTCMLLDHILSTARVCDEEDLPSPFTLGIDVRSDVNATKKSLDSAISLLSLADGNKDLVSRLSFRRSLNQILESLWQGPQDAVALKRLADLCDETCVFITAMEGSPLPQELVDSAPGFVPNVNFRSMGVIPPRKLEIVSYKRALELWKCILERFATTCRWAMTCSGWPDLCHHFLSCATQNASLPVLRAMTFFLLTNCRRNELARAAAADKKTDKTDRDVPQQVVVIPWTPSVSMISAMFEGSSEKEPLSHISDASKLFFEQCVIAIEGWCHTMSLNRSRQRSALTRLLEDWRNMMEHAYNAESDAAVQKWFIKRQWKWKVKDEAGNPFAGPLSAWVEYETACSMLRYAMLGIPLDLYAPHEFCALYWYCDYLLGAAAMGLKELESMRPVAKKGKHAPPLPYSQELQRLEVERLLCQGVVRLCLAFAARSDIGSWFTPPSGALNTGKERFRQRFGVFEILFRPEPLSYDSFIESLPPENELSLKGEEALKFWLAAYEAFGTANTQSQNLGLLDDRYLKGLRRIIIQNMTAIKLLFETERVSSNGEATKSSDGRGALRAHFDFKVALDALGTTGVFFPTLVLKRESSGHE